MADALEGRVGRAGREGFLEKVTQRIGRHTPGTCIDHLPDALCHLGPVLASAEPKATSINGHTAREGSHLPRWCQHPACHGL